MPYSMNKQAFQITGTTFEDFEKWCKLTGSPLYAKSSKTSFFKGILDGTIRKSKEGIVICNTA